MITDYITEKQLILYGVLNNYNGFTINNSDNTVAINVNIAFNVSDIDDKINELETEKQAFESDENLNDEVKFMKIDSIQTSLEMLNKLKDKLVNG
tara:strand:+ start:95 stop:379 length:285 start_codon:yes stop_codon:yes gene_type:complete